MFHIYLLIYSSIYFFIHLFISFFIHLYIHPFNHFFISSSFFYFHAFVLEAVFRLPVVLVAFHLLCRRQSFICDGDSFSYVLEVYSLPLTCLSEGRLPVLLEGVYLFFFESFYLI